MEPLKGGEDELGCFQHTSDFQDTCVPDTLCAAGQNGCHMCSPSLAVCIECGENLWVTILP
eukprot:m.125073 g.125073  ORF g.125073 m.125073 type:complete len:61 (-) comp14485_c0_seq6:1285-1467(-)